MKVACVFGVFCVRDTVATRGQYLALIKAWWSCLFLRFFRHALSDFANCWHKHAPGN